MIHAIYIYFIINAFLVGVDWDSSSKARMVFHALFGAAFYLVVAPLIMVAGWLDRTLEIQTLFMLWFTDWFGRKVTPEGIQLLKNSYKSAARYHRWVLRQIDKKYNYGICNS